VTHHTESEKIKMEGKIVLVTGASTGLGKATAHYLASKGYRVYGTSRHASFPPKTADDALPIMVRMDVNKTVSVKQAVDFILEKEQRIDIVINNAGWGISGAVEETSMERTKALFETNYFGTQRVCQAVIPTMRAQKSGYVINISSIGGVLGLPFQGLYSATKFAVEGMTEALRMEVRSFGIHVVLIEPGDFRTSFTDHREKTIHATTDPAYNKMEQSATSIFEHDERNGTDPKTIAHLIEKIISSSNPKLRYRAGSFSQKLVAKMKGVLPDRLVQWILMKYYHLI